jgi:hypothetical protein
MLPVSGCTGTSEWQIRALVGIFTLLLFGVNFVGNRLVFDEWHKVIGMIAVTDAVAALMVGVLVLKLAEYAFQRLAECLEIADLNHHIRNALETISLTAYATNNGSDLHDFRRSGPGGLGVARNPADRQALSQ